MTFIDLFEKYEKYNYTVLITTDFTEKELMELKIILLSEGYPVTSLEGRTINTNYKVLGRETAYLIFDSNNQLLDLFKRLITKYDCIKICAYCECGTIDTLFNSHTLFISIDHVIYGFELIDGIHQYDDVLTKYNTWHIKVLKDKAKELLN